MVTKKGVIVLLFIIAALLVVFSLGMKFYVSSQASSTQTLPNDGGRVELAVLPQENSTGSPNTGSGT